MTLDTTLTDAQLAAAATVNRALLLERFPDFDLTSGGPVDSLLVDGLKAITARADVEVNKAYAYQQIRQIAEGTVTVDDDVADALADNFFVVRRTDTPAYGDATFVVSTNRQYTISAGFTCQSGSISFTATQTYTIYPAGTTGVLETGTVKIAEQVYDSETGFLYRFTIPLTATSTDAAGALPAGTRLTTTQGWAELGYIETQSNFSGGWAAETNAQLMSRVLQGIVARMSAGEYGLRSLAQTVDPQADVSAVGANSPIMSRDRDTNYLGVSSGGCTDCYVKRGPVSRRAFVVSATVTDSGTRTLSIVLSRSQSAGVYRVSVEPVYNATPPTLIGGEVSLIGTSYGTWTDDSATFNPQTPAANDRAFSSRTQITLTVVDDRQIAGPAYVVPMTNGATIQNTYQVVVEYQANLEQIDDLMTSAEYRPAGVDLLVKAAVPCIVQLSLVAVRGNGYNGPTADVIVGQLAQLVNALPMRTAYLDQYLLSGLIRQINSLLTLQSVTMSGAIYGHDGSDIAVAQVAGRLSIPTNPTAKVSYENTYFTTTIDRVSVTLV